MGKVSRFAKIKDILYIILIAMLGCTGIVFAVLYVEAFNSGFFASYSSVVIAVFVAIISVLTVLTIVFMKGRNGVIYKLFFLTTICIAVIMTSLYLLKISGFLDKIDSVEKLREYISSFGAYALVLFVLIQFLQVVVLPIPSFITVGAGVLLFGPLKSAVFSCLGIILGSIVAYFIGRVFGFKVAKWLVGEESLNKGLKAIKGKDKIIITFMFLFPFFPDDVLCFVAGITTIKPTFFIIMIIVTRFISIFAASYSMNNSIIPYNTWWGILLWVLFVAATISLSVLVYKNGEKIEKMFSEKSNKRKK